MICHWKFYDRIKPNGARRHCTFKEVFTKWVLEALIKAMEDYSKRGCTCKEVYQACNRKWEIYERGKGQEREYDHTF